MQITTTSYKREATRFTATGQRLDPTLTNTGAPIKPGLVTRLMRYATTQMQDAGFDTQHYATVDVYTMDADRPPSEREYAVRFITEKGGYIQVSGIHVANGWPHLDFGGLKNTTLTIDEQTLITNLDNVKDVKWTDYTVGDLFEIGTGSLVDTKSAKIGKIPRISVQTTNNGIIGYYEEPLPNARYFENFISLNFFGVAYYHPYRASVEMKVHTLKLKDREFTKAVGLFLCTILNKRFNGQYSYGDQLSSSKLKNDKFKIQLPTIHINGKQQIAFDYIEMYMAAMNKVAIKNVVDYVDSHIEKKKKLRSPKPNR